MATFASSPAPRRPSRLNTHTNSPARPVRPSRFAPSPTAYVDSGSDVASAMDVDERASVMTDRSNSRLGGDQLFAKTEELSVAFYTNLPLEVKQVLRTADFSRDYYSGEIDTVTGFALVASIQTCFVWQHAQAIKGIPTCYIFSAPNPTLKPPFHALVPQGGSREPGLILVSPTGSIRFWDSIGSGLAGGENYWSSAIQNLEYDEEITNLLRADPQTYVLSTSYGRLYRLVISSAGGKYHLSTRAFAPPAPSHGFSILTSFFSSSPSAYYDSKDQSKHIHAVALGSRSPMGDRDVWALANGRVQQWSMKVEGWEQLKVDTDLTSLIAGKVVDKLLGPGAGSSCEDLELDDMAVFGDQNLVVLFSYSAKEDSEEFRRLYALAELQVSDGTLSVKDLKTVPYQTTNKPGLPVHPRIQQLYDGTIISVQFGDAVAICARNSEYRDRLELKSANDRTLGVGVSLSPPLLLVLTATTMMKVTLEEDKIEAFMPETGHTNLIKSTMMQAILYGSSPLNPLKFSFPPELNEEALMQGAEQLSLAVLKSDSGVVKQSPDMTAQLTGRKERLSWLIGFINENAVLFKMSQRSRQKLATDAEKLYGAHRLWIAHNQFLTTHPTHSVLKDAVVAYMAEIGEDEHEDVMRTFFRSKVSDLGKLLQKILDVVNAAETYSGLAASQALLPEANRIITTVLNSAFEYREYNKGVYGLEGPMINAWTSRKLVIDIVLAFFNMTSNAVESPASGAKAKKNKEPHSQLPILARVLFACIKERLDWLSTEPELQRELEDLQNVFDTMRPSALETLRRCGHEEPAYTLAERYHDFASLVSLCHRDQVYPPEENPHAARIQNYIHLYKEDFTNELFQWYIKNGEVRTMFEQEAQTGNFMDSFFKHHPNAAISWMHDLQKERYTPAAITLLQHSENAGNIDAKHLMLSIGKLAYLAQAQDANASTDDSTLDAFHHGLDFVSVHQGLVEEFRSVLVNSRTRQSIESQVDTIIKEKADKLIGSTAFTNLFKDLLRKLLQGRTLDVEEIVDLLTLKDNKESVDDYARSLLLLDAAQNIPEGRKNAAIKTVWRRIWLHDKWDLIMKTADVSDEQLNARYQQTAVFATLLTLLQRGDHDIYRPDEALVVPTVEEISGRWQGISSDHLEALQNDYNSEQDALGEFELGEVHDRIVELAQTEINKMWAEEDQE